MEVVPSDQTSAPDTHEFKVPRLEASKRKEMLDQLYSELEEHLDKEKTERLKSAGVLATHNHFSDWGLRNTFIVILGDLSEVLEFQDDKRPGEDTFIKNTESGSFATRAGLFLQWGPDAVEKMYTTIAQRREK